MFSIGKKIKFLKFVLSLSLKVFTCNRGFYWTGGRRQLLRVLRMSVLIRLPARRRPPSPRSALPVPTQPNKLESVLTRLPVNQSFRVVRSP